jgi:hypothetical protein
MQHLFHWRYYRERLFQILEFKLFFLRGFFCAVIFTLAILSAKNRAYCSDDVHREFAFLAVNASDAVIGILSWIRNNNDNKSKPFALIDKKNAKIFVFNAEGQPVASGPILLGITKRDHLDPNTMYASNDELAVDNRVTPAGRFQVKNGRDLHRKELLWFDYSNALALHTVIKVPGQQRAMRLRSETPKDNRITWGCINVSVPLYSTVISPLFKPGGGIIYVIPEETGIGDFINRGFR